MKVLFTYLSALSIALLSACSSDSWNNPYPLSAENGNILYSAFTERPKHLDPVQSYSSNEILFTAQIYEPPLQYHYLKRPYELVPLSAIEMPVVQYFNLNGERLPEGVDNERIAYTVYEISIKPGIRYQPHPAFARNKNGKFIYHNLSVEDLAEIYELKDFPYTDTRELTAKDYVYEIKRLAHPRLHSPIFGLMSDYIVGLKAYSNTLRVAANQQLKTKDKSTYLDLNNFPLEGAEVVDSHTYRIKIKGKYPQFMYWLAMPFFAPIPWEADRFYTQQGLAEKNITLDWYPVGTGPYMLTDNNPNLMMVLEKNPNFHGEAYPVWNTTDNLKSELIRSCFIVIRRVSLVGTSFYKATMMLLGLVLIVLIRPYKLQDRVRQL
jgi:ABC-type transport system substrate-binding protein